MLAAQQCSQSAAVRIPGPHGTTINGELACLEQMNGALERQIRNGLDGRFPIFRFADTPRLPATAAAPALAALALAVLATGSASP
jgi:hypothetical protein